MIDISFFRRDFSNPHYEEELKIEIDYLKSKYPFVKEINYPVSFPYLKIMRVIAISKEMVELEMGFEDDYTNEYSKEIFVVIPEDFKEKGCSVFGMRWLKEKDIPEDHLHIYKKTNNGYFNICVGVPESFIYLKHSIYECVRTADKIITSYTLYCKGLTNDIILIEYSHGERGKIEYGKDRKKYKTK